MMIVNRDEEKNRKIEKRTDKHAEIAVAVPETPVAPETPTPPEAPKKTHIPREKLAEHMGAYVWYDVKNLFGDELIPIRRMLISGMDEDQDKIFYGGNEGFDRLSYYGGTFRLWEDMPTDEERRENWGITV